MSIQDHEQQEIVSLPGFWSLAVKVAVALSVPATFSVITLLAWVVTKTFDHDTRLAVLEDRAKSSHASGSTNTNTIITSEGAKMAEAKTARGYLTTADVAEKESKSERTIVDWITSGRIVPQPVKGPKEWEISADYRIPPQTAENSGTVEVAPP